MLKSTALFRTVELRISHKHDLSLTLQQNEDQWSINGNIEGLLNTSVLPIVLVSACNVLLI